MPIDRILAGMGLGPTNTVQATATADDFSIADMWGPASTELLPAAPHRSEMTIVPGERAGELDSVQGIQVAIKPAPVTNPRLEAIAANVRVPVSIMAKNQPDLPLAGELIAPKNAHPDGNVPTVPSGNVPVGNAPAAAAPRRKITLAPLKGKTGGGGSLADLLKPVDLEFAFNNPVSLA